jgi:hypothetical protein
MVSSLPFLVFLFIREGLNCAGLIHPKYFKNLLALLSSSYSSGVATLLALLE